MSSRSARPTHPAVRLLRSTWLRPLNDARALQDLVGRVHPMSRLGGLRGRIVAVVDETADTKSFRIKLNRTAASIRPGQHVGVEVEIKGTRHRRSYSVSARPDGRHIRLTVKSQAGSRVSAWLHAHAHVGMVLALTSAAGDFVLPEAIPARLLLLGAGSGITPLMAMFDDLRHRGHAGPVVFVYSCRDEASTIFAGALREAAQAMPNLQLHIHHVANDGRLDENKLAQLLPNFADYETYLCGPDGFMRWVDAAYRAHGAQERLHSERFGLATLRSAPGEASVVHCSTSSRQFVSDGTKPLLQAAEDAGLQPKYGCRAGICRTCLCRKTSGTVENLLTGVVSDEPDQWIQLCISAARSDVALEL